MLALMFVLWLVVFYPTGVSRSEAWVTGIGCRSVARSVES